jgi:hypothetical protein
MLDTVLGVVHWECPNWFIAPNDYYIFATGTLPFLVDLFFILPTHRVVVSQWSPLPGSRRTSSRHIETKP